MSRFLGRAQRLFHPIRDHGVGGEQGHDVQQTDDPHRAQTDPGDHVVQRRLGRVHHPQGVLGQGQEVAQELRRVGVGPLPASVPFGYEPGGEEELAELTEEERQQILNELDSGAISLEDALKKLKDEES